MLANLLRTNLVRGISNSRDQFRGVRRTTGTITDRLGRRPVGLVTTVVTNVGPSVSRARPTVRVTGDTLIGR